MTRAFDEDRQVLRVTWVGLWLNLFLFVMKLVVGMVVGSAALIADATHTISDLLSDGVAIVGIRLSSRPADACHDYGHGKYETIAALTVAVLLVAAGAIIAFSAGQAIANGETSSPGYPVLTVALVSIAAKEWIFRLTRDVGRRVQSPLLQVNAWHHRSDALSSIAVLFGAIAGLAGWGHGDHAAAMAVGLMIVVVGIKSARGSANELSEGSVADHEKHSIIEAIQCVPGVRRWHNLRTRLVGREIFMDVHVLVDPELSVDQGHQICCDVEQAISRSLNRSANIVVHCEPDRGAPCQDPM